MITSKLTNGWQILSHVDTKEIAATLAVHEDENFDTFFILVLENFLAQKIPFSLSFNLKIVLKNLKQAKMLVLFRSKGFLPVEIVAQHFQ